MKKKPLIGIPAYVLPGKSGRNQHCGVAAAYLDAIIAGGGIPVLLPVALTARDLHTAMTRIDGFVLSGGSDIDPAHFDEEPQGAICESILPQRDAADLQIARYAVTQDLPLLGICRGHQVLNVALGGSLWQDIPTQVRTAIRHDYTYPDPSSPDPLRHLVNLLPDSKLASLLGTTQLRVNSVHHQAVRKPGRGMIVTAQSRDGIIEGTENPQLRFVVSVQWHPERMLTKVPGMRTLFTELVKAAAERR